MLQFAGPALQGASMIGRFGIPLLQQAGIGLGMYGIGAGYSALTNKPQAKPQLTGRQKLGQAWGTIPESLNSPQGGGFGYSRGNNVRATQPSYQDAQGNTYDAVSGRLLYGAKPRTGSGSTGGGSLGGGSSAAERAFQAEKSRVAQLTAQDPELQRYENARKAAKTQEEMNAARDIGMQVWQEKYGKTPMAQPGGAVGSFNPLMDRTFGYQTGSAPGQQIGEPTLGPSPLVPQIDQSLNPASPNYIGGEGAPLMDFTREEVTPEVIAAYQKQLLQQASAGLK
jgi:hypothetical protein